MIDIGKHYPAHGPRCIVPVPPPSPGLCLRARPIFGIETASSSLSILVPHEGERSSESLDCVFWHSILSTRSEEHTSELQSLMRISYAVFCLKKKKKQKDKRKKYTT